MARSRPCRPKRSGRKSRPCFPSHQTPQGRSSVDRRPSCAGRDFVDSAQRRSLAGSAREISTSLDVLAAAARLGGASVWLNIWRVFLSELNEREELDWSGSFLDGSFAPAKKGAQESGNQAGQGDEVDGGGRRPGCPLGDQLHSASPAEVRLAETTLAAIRVGRRHRAGRPRQKPVRVITDKAYDSDPLRDRLRGAGSN